MSERVPPGTPRTHPSEFERQSDVVTALEVGLKAAAEAARDGIDPLPILDQFKEMAQLIKESPIEP